MSKPDRKVITDAGFDDLSRQDERIEIRNDQAPSYTSRKRNNNASGGKKAPSTAPRTTSNNSGAQDKSATRQRFVQSKNKRRAKTNKLIIQESTPRAIQTIMHERFGHIEFDFRKTKPCSPHIELRIERQVAVHSALRLLGKGRILDVGFSPVVLRARANAHGCECSNSPPVVAKLKHYEKLDVTSRDDRKGYTYCRSEASLCTHGPFETALFVHSLYYNTPAQVINILKNTRSHSGISIHHTFDENIGSYYGEAEYLKDSDNVTMWIKGHSMPYQHPHVDWLKGTNVFVCPNSTGTFDVLTWTSIDLGLGVSTQMLRMTYYQCQHAPYVPPPMVSRFGLHERVLKRAINRNDAYVQFRNATDVYHTSKYMTIIRGDNTGVIQFPQRVLERGFRFLINNTITPKSVKQATSQMKAEIKQKYYTNIKVLDVLKMVPDVAAYLVEEVIAVSQPALDMLNKADVQGKISDHNEKQKWEALSLITITLPFLILFFVLQIWLWTVLEYGYFSKFFRFMTLGAIYGALRTWYGGRNFYRRLRFPEFKFLSENHDIVRLLIVCACVGSVCCGDYKIYEVVNYFTFLVGTVGFFLGIYVMCLTAVKIGDYDDWAIFRDSVELDRVTLSYSCAVPCGTTLYDVETLFDYRTVPLSPYCSIAVPPFDDKPPPKRPAVRLVGIGFTIAFPAVYSSSPYNMYIAVRTRVACEVPKPLPGAWEELNDMWLPTELIRLKPGPNGPVPINQTYYFDGELFIYEPLKYTWEVYVARYPGRRKKYMERLKVNMENGGYLKRHLVYSVFVKKEKQMIITKMPFEPKKPRVIAAVAEFNKVHTGPWFYNFSNALKFSWNPSYYIWFSSGYQPRVFNRWFDRAMRKYSHNVIFAVSDFSTYDVTQGAKCMSREERVFRDLNFTELQFGEDVLQSERKTVMYGNGVKFKGPPLRKSGSNPTSSGNSKNTAEAWEFAVRPYLVPDDDYMFGVLGDDNFGIFRKNAIILKYGSVENFERITKSRITALGYKIKLLVTETVLDAEYLSLKFYPTFEGYKIGKKPGRVLTKLGWFLTNESHNRPRETWLGIFLGTMKSYMPTGNHVPFLRRYLWIMTEYILRNYPDVKAIPPDEEWFMPWLASNEVYEADDLTFYAFNEAYGLSEHDEELFAAEIRSALDKYGIPCVVDSHYVDLMFNKEQVL